MRKKTKKDTKVKKIVPEGKSRKLVVDLGAEEDFINSLKTLNLCTPEKIGKTNTGKFSFSFVSSSGVLAWVTINGEGVSFNNTGKPKYTVTYCVKTGSDDANNVLNFQKSILGMLDKKIFDSKDDSKRESIKIDKFVRYYNKDFRSIDDVKEAFYVGFPIKTNISFRQEDKDGSSREVKKKITIYNSKGDSLNDEETSSLSIGNGSLGIVYGLGSLYHMNKTFGVTFYLNALQLLKYVEYEGSSIDVKDHSSEGDFFGLGSSTNANTDTDTKKEDDFDLPF